MELKNVHNEVYRGCKYRINKDINHMCPVWCVYPTSYSNFRYNIESIVVPIFRLIENTKNYINEVY